MGYVEKNLMPNEKIIFSTHLNPLKQFLLPILFILFGGLVLLGTIDSPIGYVVAGIGVLLALRGYIAISQSEFAVTNKRVIIKVGLVRRQSLDIMLSKVESIGLNQSVSERLLGCGTIVVNGSGNVSQSFPNVQNPVEFRKQVQVQISEREAA